MKSLPYPALVDASMLIQLFIVDRHTEIVKRYFGGIVPTTVPIVAFIPDLLYIECANILWKHIKRLGYDQEQARKDMEDLDKLHLLSTPTHELMTRALELAYTHGITAYDASYVALAERLSLPVLTLDNRFATAMANTTFQVIALDG